MQLNEELLRKAGVTEITYENNQDCAGLCYDNCAYVAVANEPTFRLSLELDKNKLEDFQKAIEKLGSKTDEMELKNELLIMHEVNACPGSNFTEKFDNYMEAKTGEPKIIEGINIIQRYKIKHK